VFSKDSKAFELSKDHKPENKNELERIINAGGEIIEGRINGNINLSRAIGDFEYKANSKLRVDQ